MENIVYTISKCPYCVAVKQLLDRHDVDFEEQLLKTREDLDNIKKQYNWRTMPAVILNGKFIGGYVETQKLIKAGKLDETLGL